MAFAVQSVNLRSQILEHMDAVAQEERGKDLDVLIDEIAQIKIDRLVIEDQMDIKDSRKIRLIKFGLAISAVCLSIIAVISAIVTIILSAQTASPSPQIFAIVTGSVSICTSFNQLDGSIKSFISTYTDIRVSTSRIKTIENKITVIRKLIDARIKNLTNFDDQDIKNNRVSEILDQIQRVNDFVTKVKEKIPQQIDCFDILDPAPLLDFIKTH